MICPTLTQFRGWMNRQAIFSVKGCYALLHANHIPFGPPGEFDKALTFVWKTEVPTKIKAFGWRCFIDRLLTKEALAKRGIFPIYNSSFVFCNMTDESLRHLFLNCLYVNLVWKDIAE